MALPRVLPLLLGALALLTTSTVVVIHIILTSYVPEPLAVQRASIVSSILEGIALFALSWLYATYFLHTAPQYPKRFPGIAFGCSILVCALATISAVVTLIILGRVTADTKATFQISTQRGFLIGSSVALGLSFACQLVFVVVHFVFARINGHSVSSSAHQSEEDQPAQVHVKSIPYSHTSPVAGRTGSASGERTRPQSSGGRSVSDTMGSIRTSISSVVRPLSSRRLLAREKRSASLDSMAYRDHKSVSVEDGFDSWDTSSVDPQNRQTVMQSASPTPARLLETIPASPTTSRSPSPGYPLDLEPPSRVRTRSRSFSPAGTRIPRERDLPPPPPNSESHIHPLFRSESPTPPAILTPGTVVMAAPHAGQVISDRQSIRSLTRMRSGSLPAPSPLSRQGSFDDFVLLRPGTRDTPEASIHEALLEQEEEETVKDADVKNGWSKRVQEEGEGVERRMTPPIPEWILCADGRNSMSDYNRRTRGGSEEPAS